MHGRHIRAEFRQHLRFLHSEFRRDYSYTWGCAFSSEKTYWLSLWKVWWEHTSLEDLAFCQDPMITFNQFTLHIRMCYFLPFHKGVHKVVTGNNLDNICKYTFSKCKAVTSVLIKTYRVDSWQNKSQVLTDLLWTHYSHWDSKPTEHLQ